MGISADLSAVRAATKVKRKKLRSSKGLAETRDNTTTGVIQLVQGEEGCEIVTPALRRRKAAADRQAASTLRLQEISALQFATGLPSINV